MIFDKLLMVINKYEQSIRSDARRIMDNNLGRLKTICRVLYYILMLFTFALIILVAMLALADVAILVNPGLGSEVGISAPQMTVVLIIFVFALAIVYVLQSITKSIYREYSPFTPANAKRFQTIAVLCLLALVCMPIVNVIEPLTASDVAIIILAMLLMSTTFYVLSLVFRYGSWLQKESDETL